MSCSNTTKKFLAPLYTVAFDSPHTIVRKALFDVRVVVARSVALFARRWSNLIGFAILSSGFPGNVFHQRNRRCSSG